MRYGTGLLLATCTWLLVACGSDSAIPAKKPIQPPKDSGTVDAAAAAVADPKPGQAGDEDGAGAGDGDGEAGESTPPPRLADKQLEMHGTFHGEPFWLRLGLLDPKLGGKQRLLQLQYTPPKPEAMGGTHLCDHPALAVTSQLFIGGWKDDSTRPSMTLLYYDPNKKGYHSQREFDRKVGDDTIPDSRTVDIAGAPAWDLHLAPLLLSLIWRPEQHCHVAVVDLLGEDHAKRQQLTWQGDKADCAGQQWRIGADDAGRLQSIRSDTGTLILEVQKRQPALGRQEVMQRQQRIKETGAP